MTIYTFPTRSRGSRPKFEYGTINTREPEDAIGLLQGQVPDSKQEWWVGSALNRLAIPWTYQFPVNGGRSRGGYLIDFVVHTDPLATMFEIEGNHWHTGELGADDKKRQADIEQLMQDICRIPIISLWVPDLLDSETVFQKMREYLL